MCTFTNMYVNHWKLINVRHTKTNIGLSLSSLYFLFFFLFSFPLSFSPLFLFSLCLSLFMLVCLLVPLSISISISLSISLSIYPSFYEANMTGGWVGEENPPILFWTWGYKTTRLSTPKSTGVSFSKKLIFSSNETDVTKLLRP